MTLGLLLAAGTGRRTGVQQERPQGLLRADDDVPFVDRAVATLLGGGCDVVTVVLGAAAEEVLALLDEAGWNDDAAVDVVYAYDWAEGIRASVGAGLRYALSGSHDAAVLSLVELPDVDAAVVRRLLDVVPPGPEALGRATYEGRPGHPVLLGRDHWPDVLDSALGDGGALAYLADHRVVDVDCSDLATGHAPERFDAP